MEEDKIHNKNKDSNVWAIPKVHSHQANKQLIIKYSWCKSKNISASRFWQFNMMTVGSQFCNCAANSIYCAKFHTSFVNTLNFSLQHLILCFVTLVPSKNSCKQSGRIQPSKADTLNCMETKIIQHTPKIKEIRAANTQVIFLYELTSPEQNKRQTTITCLRSKN